ncbi:hypothetical protein JB92DRAFT_3132620 [Gautieria morchelliformis]|nr:hypothetical protein JB92DRAFT_3132620 [Gautieria morchelliformis]
MGAIVNVEYASHSHTHTFNVAVADYVRDCTNSFLLECICNDDCLPPNQSPTLDIGTSIYVYGTLHGINAYGNLNIAVDDLTLNVAPSFMGPLLPCRHSNLPSLTDAALPPHDGQFPLALPQDKHVHHELSNDGCPSESHAPNLTPHCTPPHSPFNSQSVILLSLPISQHSSNFKEKACLTFTCFGLKMKHSPFFSTAFL